MQARVQRYGGYLSAIYLLPLLIGFTAGTLVYGHRGGVVRAIVTAGSGTPHTKSTSAHAAHDAEESDT